MAKKSHNTSDELREIPSKLIRESTDDFGEGHKLGSGGFATVYKGVLYGGEEIAVKVFHRPRVLNDSQFQQELKNLRRLNHPNIVKVVGFCNESEEEPWEFEGKQGTAPMMHMALCLEFLHGGSLQKHISEESTGLNWRTRYKIIRGVCEGLKYLHEGLEPPLLHLDLKPGNILLDKNNVPKIADFGLSKLFGDENNIETSSMVTRGYCPQEYIKSKRITEAFDIFSLGVIILKIVTGRKGYELIDDKTTEQFVDYVHDNWRCRLGEILSPRSLEAYCKQVKRCTEIGLECINRNRLERPTIGQIVSTLVETEKVIFDLGLQIEQLFRGEEPVVLKKNLQEVLSPERQRKEMVDEVSSRKTKASEPSSPSTLSKELSLEFLKKITKDFSDERRLREDAFGTSYKGIYDDKKVIVVKRLKEDSPVSRDKAFNNEVQIIPTLKHENIVELVGHCNERQKVKVSYNGTYIEAEIVESLLCYEYLPRGSVFNYIFDEPSISDWGIRFKIIKGICEGLLYLHKIPIIHMDLKPENVFLDTNFVAKIADFGMSRIFDQGQTRENTENVVGSHGFIAPEYFYKGEISTQTDIYSLGLTIIEIVTIERNARIPSKPSARPFIEKVREKWTYDHIVSVHPSVDAISLQQIKACIEIGLECVEIDGNKRPSIENIVNRISGTFQC